MWTTLLDWLFPPRCAGCGARGAWLCRDCVERAMRWRRATPRCPTCDRAGAAHSCAPCRKQPSPLLGMRVAGDYAPPLRDAILALKFGGKRAVAEPLGIMLADLWRREGAPAVSAIVTIPMPADRLRQRGYNAAELVARACGRRLGLPVASGTLIRTRAAPPQHQLNGGERRRNAAGLFAVAPAATTAVRGNTLLIIDDVTTTGATLDAAANALLAAGAAGVWGLAVARPTLDASGR